MTFVDNYNYILVAVPGWVDGIQQLQIFAYARSPGLYI